MSEVKGQGHIINSRLVLYMEINDIFADEQNGFRKLPPA